MLNNDFDILIRSDRYSAKLQIKKIQKVSPKLKC